MDDAPTTPQEVWALIERADELVKYAQNRDPATAYTQARATLERALDASRSVAGAEKLTEQAERRLADLAKLEGS